MVVFLLLMVRTVTLVSLVVVMATVVLMAVVSVDDTSETAGNRAVEGANGGVGIAHVAGSGSCVAYGSDSSGSVDGSGSIDDTAETAGNLNNAAEGANLIMRIKLWEITRLRIRIWRMICYVKQLKKVNNSIVVGLKVANRELKKLWKAECDVQRKKLTTVVRNNLQIVKDLARSGK